MFCQKFLRNEFRFLHTVGPKAKKTGFLADLQCDPQKLCIAGADEIHRIFIGVFPNQFGIGQRGGRKFRCQPFCRFLRRFEGILHIWMRFKQEIVKFGRIECVDIAFDGIERLRALKLRHSAPHNGAADQNQTKPDQRINAELSCERQTPLCLFCRWFGHRYSHFTRIAVATTRSP